MEALKELRRRVDAAKLRYTVARETLKKERVQLSEARERVDDAAEAQKAAQIIAQGVQQQARERITAIVTRCLAAVFPNPYEFNIRFEQKRGRTEAALEFVRDGLAVNPMDAAGGGAVDVASFALRLSCILLSRPPVRRVMFMDEPFKFVSKDHRAKLRTLLHSLSEELDVQFILVTHLPELEMGKVVDISNADAS